MKKELRTFEMQELRAVAKDDDKTPRITGYAAVFNKWSEDLGGFKEKISPGAFRETLKTADVRALFNHDPNYVLGRTSAKTLSLEENNTGLKVQITPPGTQWADDLLVSINRGDISQMSFGFRVIEDDWHDKPSGIQRVIQEVELFDVSPVTFPAYPQTSVALRDMMKSEGLDLEALTRVMIRHERGMSIKPDDIEFLQRTMGFLRGIYEERVIPKDVSRDLADRGESWDKLRLQDFTEESWENLSNAEKRKIAGHFAFSFSMPPETFGDMKLGHHRASDGAVVWRGVAAAWQRAGQVQGLSDSDLNGIYSHLASHYKQFDEEPPDFNSLEPEGQEPRDQGEARLQLAKRRVELARLRKVCDLKD